MILLVFLMVPCDTQAAPPQPGTSTQAEGQAKDVGEIKIGSTFLVGTTYVGGELTRSFRLVNKDATRPMTITNFNIHLGDENHNPWFVKQRPPASIPPGEEGFFSITLIGTQVGVSTASVFWNADTDPPSEEDTFFTFGVKGEILARPKK